MLPLLSDQLGDVSHSAKERWPYHKYRACTPEKMPKTSNPKNTDKQSANGNDADTKQQAPAMNAVAIEEILMDEHALNELVTTGLATDELVTDALRSCLQASWNSCHLGITAENQYTQQLGE